MNGLAFDPLTRGTPLFLVTERTFPNWLSQQPSSWRHWLTATCFQPQTGHYSLLPGKDGEWEAVVVSVKHPEDLWALSHLPKTLPEGKYHLVAEEQNTSALARLTLGWALGAYQFTRYRQPKRAAARLIVDPALDRQRLRETVDALTLTRDLINTPAEELMPEHLAEIGATVAQHYGATYTQIVGEDLLTANFPMIHAVGRASVHPPRLLDLRWGDPTHPKVTLVGKGVCFDSGGINLKSASGMRLMKKDLGGAAIALGLARLIMGMNLPIRLRLLIPAVDNAVAGNAFRPGDVLRSRQGLTVEIQNTDAEGRLILGDALTEAGAEQPALLIDFATLTGAARTALGAEIPALFCNDKALVRGILAAAEHEQDPCWPLPLYEPYRELLDSKIADLANAADSPYAGAITAALFLREFVPAGIPWVHFDLMAWNLKSKPGRPEGGEAMTLRAVFSWLEQWVQSR